MFTQTRRILGLTLGFSFIAAPVCAQATPDIKVEKVEVASQAGRTVSLKVFGKKAGQGPDRQAIKVFWLDGANRREIFNGTGRFDGSAAGFMNTISVQLPSESGRVEVEAGDLRVDPRPADNKKPLTLGGADLKFESSNITVKAGATPNRELVLLIANDGPGAVAAGCRVEIDLAERGPARRISVNLPAIPNRAKYQKKVPYHFVASPTGTHNTLHAQIVCPADTVPGNNLLDKRLNN